MHGLQHQTSPGVQELGHTAASGEFEAERLSEKRRNH
jgi:hypothetical protein